MFGAIMNDENNEYIALLKKENTILKQKFQRSEQNRERLEKINDNRYLLLKNLNQELEENKKVIEENNKDIKNNLDLLKSTQAQLVHAEKMSSLGQLVAGIAHEINNPMNFISTGIYQFDKMVLKVKKIIIDESIPEDIQNNLMSEMSPGFEKVDKLLDIMRRGCSRIIDMISSLNKFSCLSVYPDINVNLHEGIDYTLIILQHKLKFINVKKEYNSIPLISCMAAEINQVIMNICSNAADALEENKVLKPHLILRTNHDSDNIYLEFENNGPSISDNIKEKIFEPFYTTKKIGKGTGLGLSISKNILHKHNGNLRLVTGEWGSKFIVELPNKNY